MKKEEEIIQALNNNNIPCEVATFRITEELERARDGDWNRYISEYQCVVLSSEDGYGSVYGSNDKGLPIPIGHLSKRTKAEYEHGIICEFNTKELTYQSGEIRECLDYYQQIILFNGQLPDGAAEHFGLRGQAKGVPKKMAAAPKSAKPASTEDTIKGCLILIFLFFVLKLALC